MATDEFSTGWKFDRSLCSYGTAQYFRSVHTELWTTKRIVKLASCVRNTYTREFLTGRKYVRCPMKIALVYIFTLYMMSEDWGEVCSRSHSYLIHSLERRLRRTQSKEYGIRYIYIYMYTRFQKGFHIERYIDRYILLFSCTCAREHLHLLLSNLWKNLVQR